MVKIRAGDLYIFGLSAVNLRRLMDGQPIAFDVGESLHGDWKRRVLIFYGQTEEAMMQEISEFIGPETDVTIPERDKH